MEGMAQLPEFQSFLSWNWLLKLSGQWRAKQAKRVSILLIVELAFEGLKGLKKQTIKTLFQSFLSWNWLLKVEQEKIQWSGYSVSILLIVELAFEVCRLQGSTC